MKQTHAAALPHILRAIESCGQDERMAPVRSLLRQAAEACGRVGGKRVRRETAMERYAQEAVARDKQWWETIRKNVGLGMPLPERISDDEGRDDPSPEW